MSTAGGSLGVNDLLVEVFLELEELDDKLLLWPAVIHERKKLQALVSMGTTHEAFCFQVTQIVTIERD